MIQIIPHAVELVFKLLVRVGLDAAMDQACDPMLKDVGNELVSFRSIINGLHENVGLVSDAAIQRIEVIIFRHAEESTICVVQVPKRVLIITVVATLIELVILAVGLGVNIKPAVGWDQRCQSINLITVQKKRKVARLKLT